MTSPPIFRINCRRASEVKLGNRTRNGVLITSEDLSTLRLLANRDLAVSLECDGVIIFQANVKALLRRTVYLADRIHILSAGPGRVVDEVEIDLPLHRTEDIKNTKRFRELETLVLDKIRREAAGGNVRITT